MRKERTYTVGVANAPLSETINERRREENLKKRKSDTNAPLLAYQSWSQDTEGNKTDKNSSDKENYTGSESTLFVPQVKMTPSFDASVVSSEDDSSSNSTDDVATAVMKEDKDFGDTTQIANRGSAARGRDRGPHPRTTKH